MKDRIYILLLSALLLGAVSYVQVFQKIVGGRYSCMQVINDASDDAEEGSDNTSEENSREIDQDEDAFNSSESLVLLSSFLVSGLKNDTYSFSRLRYYPEIVSPPPQI
jgi:hypothetical protein